MLQFRAEHGRNYARVIRQINAELSAPRRSGAGAGKVLVYLLTHGECQLPPDDVAALAARAPIYGVFILPRAYRLGREALRILLQEAPAGTDLALITSDLAAIPGVIDVHDLHVWTLTSEMDVLTAHLMTSDGTDGHSVLDDARTILTERHGIGHATLQVEPSSHRGCDEIDW